MNNMNNMNSCEKKKLMRLIQQYSFAVTEAVLYLDTHPHCPKALKFREKYVALREDAVKLYEEKYGPLTMYCGTADDCWKWVKEPWPWEYDCKCDGR